MKGRNTTTVAFRLPDDLLVMVKASAGVSGKTLSEYIKDTLAEKYPHWRDRRWEDSEGTGND